MVKEGSISSIIFSSGDGSYTVLRVDGEDGVFTAVGSMPQASIGGFVRFTGENSFHQVYGEQFKFDTYSFFIPDTPDGKELFLGSGVLKGIGPKTASAMMQTFGDDVFNILEHNYSKLVSIRGISLKKARQAHECYVQHRDFAEVSIYFQNYGISMSTITKLYTQYGVDTIKIVEDNPYFLLSHVRGMGFKRVDKIAQQMGVDPSDARRVKAGIVDCLYEDTKNGDTYSFRDDYENSSGRTALGLVATAANRLGVNIADVEEMLFDLTLDGRVRLGTIEDKSAVWLSKLYEAEAYCASKLNILNSSELSPVAVSLDKLIAQSEKDMEIELDEVQKMAVTGSVSHGVFVITGGPGTGKSTIVRAILDIFEFDGKEVMVATPTGRAAKRVTEISGFPAMTIHRMLGAQPAGEDESFFLMDESNPLSYDLIIVDEASMIDIVLMEALLKAITSGTRLILVGDADQLPPVGPGNVLNDVIASEKVETKKLINIYRQAAQSLIIKNAHSINKGGFPISGKFDQDFFIIKESGESNILDTIVSLVTTRLPQAYKNLDNIKDIQVITPTKRGVLGSVNLNTVLRNALNPEDFSRDEIKVLGKVFRVGDKVMHISNNYGLEWFDEASYCEGEGVFNGDIGFIHAVDSDLGTLSVLYDGTKYVNYDLDEAADLEHAYAITIHKSQGSEFSHIIIPMTSFPPMLAYRNLIYTGVTRGKNMVIIVGQPQYLKRMIDNEMILERKSGLRYFLVNEANII